MDFWRGTYISGAGLRAAKRLDGAATGFAERFRMERLDALIEGAGG